MSNEAITWAYRQTLKSPGAKFVLVALADMADDEHSCYPGQDKLAAMTGQGQRTVRRQLLELELMGLITRKRRFDKLGHRTSDRYVLPVGAAIPTGQSGQWPIQPEANTASGQDDQRSAVQPYRPNEVIPTGQIGQVSLREQPKVEPSVKKRRSKALVVAERQDVERVCRRLADAIEANGSNRPTVTDTWRTQARLLMDADGRTEEQVSKCIDWCQADEFWSTVILSMPKLRAKYDQLRLAAARTAKPKNDIDGISLRAAERMGALG